MRGLNNLKIEINENDITIDKEIAAGGTSSVYYAKWHRTTVAVKKFRIKVDFLEVELLKYYYF